MSNCSNHVCGAELAGGLDNGLRRFLHNPDKIFAGLIEPGQTVVDLGCGPGTFTVDLARMVGEKGAVIAVDMQQKMLDLLAAKAAKYGMGARITPHLCRQDGIGLEVEADFALAFFMVHEVPDLESFFKEVGEMIKPGGKLLLVEPIIHVSGARLLKELETAERYGLKLKEKRKVFFSRAFILEKVFSF